MRKNISIVMLVLFGLFTIAMCSARLATPANVKGKKAKHIPKHVAAYVNRFLKTAKAEADSFNIPVSIILAQGIVESNSGRSELSVKYNNHFGVKCKKCKRKEYALFFDDGPNNKFRIYKTAWRSYRDHSKLLCGPIYKHLLKLHRTDYKGWAKGLKKAGYATNPKYAQVLISVIDNYGLWVYDYKIPGL